MKLDEYGLTEQQRRFSDNFIETTNGTESAIKAGYSKRNARFYASRLLNENPAVKKYIAMRLKELEDAKIAKVEEVLRFFTSCMRGEIKEDVVVIEGKGKGGSNARVVPKQISAKDRILAANALAKRYGLDKPDNAIDGNNGGVTIVDDTDKA